MIENEFSIDLVKSKPFYQHLLDVMVRLFSTHSPKYMQTMGLLCFFFLQTKRKEEKLNVFTLFWPRILPG